MKIDVTKIDVKKTAAVVGALFVGVQAFMNESKNQAKDAKIGKIDDLEKRIADLENNKRN